MQKRSKDHHAERDRSSDSHGTDELGRLCERRAAAQLSPFTSMEGLLGDALHAPPKTAERRDLRRTDAAR